MTLKQRLARSNLIMLVVPVVVAGVLLLLGLGLGMFLLERVYLPRLGISLQALHQTGEQLEGLLKESALLLGVYVAAVAAALLVTVGGTNVLLTRSLFRHIAQPLDTLVAGVARIRDGDLDSPIAYPEADEFRAACDAVDEMAARLKATLEQEQQERQKKQELIAGMSHDLKSPLTSIRAYTEALLDGVAQDEETRRRYLHTIHTKEGDIEAMVNRLFTFAKLNACPLQPEAVPLAPALAEWTAPWQGEGMDLRLDIPADLSVRADRALLGRIVANLLDNSRRYSGREDVQVTVTARRRADGVEIAFADNGAGVPPEQLPKLFDAFYRGDAARTAPASGSGLGLAVVSKACEEMGGSVRAENQAGGGLCVVLTLPENQEGPNG